MPPLLQRLQNSSKKLKVFTENCVEPVEEYEPVGFHPVQLGNTFESGHYLIVHKLGLGGFSIVWLAHDSCRKKYVALNFIAAKHSKTKRDCFMGLTNSSEHSSWAVLSDAMR